MSRTAQLTTAASGPLPATAQIPVTICDPKHPHFGECGVLTGETIRLTFTSEVMAYVRLEACVHGSEACYVGKGQVRTREQL